MQKLTKQADAFTAPVAPAAPAAPTISRRKKKWLTAFLRIESLRGLQFNRPIMPIDAVSKKLRLIGLSDAAKPIIMVGIWGGFELPNGDFSCRLIIGRSILSSDTTIPKLELDGTCSVANLGWMVRTALKGWEVSYVQGADSTIAISWLQDSQLRWDFLSISWWTRTAL